jgi:glycosyltransferase 2 family protein
MGSTFWLMGDPMMSESGLRWVFRACGVLLAVGAMVWVLMGFLTDRRVHRFAGRLSLIPKVGGVFSELWRSVWLYRKKPGIVYLTLAMTIGLHVLNVFAFHFAVRVFTPNSAEWATLGEHFILVPVGLVVRALFPAPGGAGGAEFGFGKLYELAGRPATVGILGSLALLVLAWVLGAVAYVIGMAMRPTKSTAVPSPIAP